MTTSGAFRERLFGAWVEIRENLGRSILQALGVLLGVASVLGGFSISDSQRRRADQMFVKMGGLDKLNIQPKAAVRDGQPTALQQANLGLRDADAIGGEALKADAIQGVSRQKNARSRVVSAYGDQDRQISGIGGDFIPANGYAVARGRGFSATEMDTGAPVVILGTEAAQIFFPKGDAVGQTLRIGAIPVTVIGTFEERVFRFREGQRNQFWWRNRIIAVPANLVQRRMNGDAYRRVDRISFRIPDLAVMGAFAEAAFRSGEGQPPAPGGLPPGRCGRPHPPPQQPGRRLRHHLHALGRAGPGGRRHREREHPDGRPQRTGPRGGCEDGPRRLWPGDLQRLHDRGPVAYGPRAAWPDWCWASASPGSSPRASASPST